MTISIKPTASGSTIEQNGSTILTVDNSGNITPTNGLYPKGPAFSAYSTIGISITKDVWTKLPLNATQFDTTGDYNTSTYRFTPSVAGYYHLISNIHSNTAIDAGPYYYYTRFDKNGSVYLYTSSFHTTSSIFTNDNTLNSSTLVYLNGTTDYVELYAYQSSASSTITMNGGADRNTFSGFLVRAT